ncbi:carbon-monoxide dehydrogenase medium subunit [Anaerosolibacter carboniphilus]|uniref:Carbon-monoxide dehydrogenase medium subunit n=1 Tax=Anaerosolibacter carboniphilus TaxID=1417629 RepID=A0A841KU42_9FIRM|nr:xanthine dehydrogenase family protein subunit M [Anaerosolibacter carboniphilus]MBB6216893.1 carbon-monoxide dehydrogenase medium subunit [Anaerosolibacter carboniphilus]
MKSFEYFKPRTLEEASALLIKYGDKASILNGGTDLIVRMHDGVSHPEVVIDIKGIAGLKKMEFNENEGLTIGACVTMNDMAQDAVLLEKYRILAEASHTVGSCQVRNRATLVGNITNASPLADTATPLLALDAFVKVFGPGGEREISIHEFFVWVRKTCLQAGEIVIGVRLPNYEENVLGTYQKHARKDEVDLSTVCASVVKADGTVRIALGSVAPTPIRAKKTEEFLAGKALTEEIINQASEIVLSEISPIDDIRASKQYRQDIVKILVKRGLIELSK